MHNVISIPVRVCPSQPGGQCVLLKAISNGDRPGLEPGTPWSVVAKLIPVPARPFYGTIGFSQAKLSKRSFVVNRALAHGFNYFFIIIYSYFVVIFWYSLLDILTIRNYMI